MVPASIVQRLLQSYTTEMERTCAAGEYWVNTAPYSSWESLALALYEAGDNRAVEKLAQYLPKGTYKESVQRGNTMTYTVVLSLPSA